MKKMSKEFETEPDINSIDENDEKAMSQAKLWLFKENMRLGALAKELEEKEAVLQKEEEQLKNELKAEMKKLQVRESQLILQKKHVDDQLNILRRGFEELNADRASFEAKQRSISIVEMAPASLFFRGIHSESKLKKRYRELLKIFHPDNNSGDEETVMLIKKEYEEIKDNI